MLWDSYIFIIYWIGVGLPCPVVVVLLAHRFPALRFVPRSFYVLQEPDQLGTYLFQNQYIRIRKVTNGLRIYLRIYSVTLHLNDVYGIFCLLKNL